MASIVAAPNHHTGCIHVVAGTHGVRIAGIMLQASQNNWNLLQWGSPHTADDGSPLNPGLISDLFVRVGGPDVDLSVCCDTMVAIHSSYVIGDNLWLWRADHTALAPGETPEVIDGVTQKYHLVRHNPPGPGQGVPVECACNTGLYVTGTN